jgi:hypothetical protein
MKNGGGEERIMRTEKIIKKTIDARARTWTKCTGMLESNDGSNH